MAKPLQPKNEAEVGKLRAKLNYAGFRGETAPSVFLGLKTICLILGFLAGGGAMLFTKGATTEAIMYTVGIAGIGFYIPEVILWFFKKSRQDNIFFGLPDALDLMVVCVEAGLGLDQAMRKVSEEMKKTYPASPKNTASATYSFRWAAPATKCCTISAPALASTT
jgi:tight adherence protein C